jgi:hypothetical protein
VYGMQMHSANDIQHNGQNVTLSWINVSTIQPFYVMLSMIMLRFIELRVVLPILNIFL